MSAKRPNYGLDAPGVVGILGGVALIGLLLYVTAVAGLWSGSIAGFPLAGIGIGFTLTCGSTALLMVYSSKVGKIRGRDKLLNLIPWRGDEQVLDVGCGRGLMVIGAAKKLNTGKAFGIDIWQTADLSGNRPDAAIENAQLEGVADRIAIRTADMRDMPFANETFDSIVSSWAVHNLYEAKEREKALREVARVLKPGGWLLIRDIKHGAEYATVLTDAGLTNVRRVDNRLLSAVATLWTFGGVRPAILVGQKKI